MSIPEASQLVLQAALMGKGGEIFVLDMGDPMKIADLARQMIRLSGFTEQDIRVVYSGLRPGEKLFEEVLVDGEATLPTQLPNLRIARARAPENAGLPEEVLAWLAASSGAAPDTVRARLKAWIPEYVPAQ
jgi:FlaA1/EpsC-like NDP-sugar epimerase